MPERQKRHSDEQLLSEAYDRFGSMLHRYLAGLLSSRDAAEDAMQEVFLRLLRVARRDPKALENRFYLLRVARNEAFRALSRKRRLTDGSSDGLLSIRDPRQGSDVERLAIEEALDRLPDEQREAVQLKIYMSMTFAEIAEATKVSQDTAASRYRYAIQKLRELLAEEETT